MKKIFLSILILPIFIFAENPDTTLKKIKANQKLIISACKQFNVDSKILSSIIYVERTQNYTWEDDALDEYLAQAGLNSSIGFCQVKLKTAYWIEVQLKDTNSLHYPGKDYDKILSISDSPGEIISKLQKDSLNILYAAAYLKIIQNRWQKEKCSIKDKPEILGTLYSTGLFYKNGKERKPNKEPKFNKFGELVLKSFKYF